MAHSGHSPCWAGRARPPAACSGGASVLVTGRRTLSYKERPQSTGAPSAQEAAEALVGASLVPGFPASCSSCKQSNQPRSGLARGRWEAGTRAWPPTFLSFIPPRQRLLAVRSCPKRCLASFRLGHAPNRTNCEMDCHETVPSRPPLWGPWPITNRLWPGQEAWLFPSTMAGERFAYAMAPKCECRHCCTAHTALLSCAAAQIAGSVHGRCANGAVVMCGCLAVVCCQRSCEPSTASRGISGTSQPPAWLRAPVPGLF
jgi:hypothetical protein